MPQVKVKFYLPVEDNDERELVEEIQKVEQELYDEFGAWTQEGNYYGAYKMKSGKQKLDVCLVYSVVVEEEMVSKIDEILMRFKSKTDQESIYREIQRDVQFDFL